MGLNTQIVTMVSGPSLPIYITSTSRSLLRELSPGVMPVDRPTVPKADVISNRISSKGIPGSRIHMKKVPRHTTRADSAVTMAAL